MAKVRVTNTTGVVHGAAIAGLRDVSFDITTVEKEFASDGEATEFDSTDFTVRGEATFDDVVAYNDALNNVEANLVVTGRVSGGASTKTFTAKNAKFTGARIAVPTRQDRGIGTYRCQIRCRPGPSDTIDGMITVA